MPKAKTFVLSAISRRPPARHYHSRRMTETLWDCRHATLSESPGNQPAPLPSLYPRTSRVISFPPHFCFRRGGLQGAGECTSSLAHTLFTATLLAFSIVAYWDYIDLMGEVLASLCFAATDHLPRHAREMDASAAPRPSSAPLITSNLGPKEEKRQDSAHSPMTSPMTS